MIAFDSNVLIYVLEDNPDFVEQSIKILSDVNRHGGVCSSLVVTECVRGNITSFAQMLPLHSSAIQIVPVTLEVAELAGQLRQRHNTLKTPDAIHLATAIKSGAKTFVTNDHDLAKTQAGIKMVLL